MGLFNFVKEAGQSLFGKDDDAASKEQLAEVLERKREKKLAEMVGRVGIEVEDLKVAIEGDTVTLTGRARNQEEREKIVLLIGNTQGVAKVDDRLRIAEPVPEQPTGVVAVEATEMTDGGAVFHTVARGDTLSAIARKYYGSASKYPLIFEANKPMLTDPDRIYPGQVLRIPAES